jgi:hypothetical protein
MGGMRAAVQARCRFRRHAVAACLRAFASSSGAGVPAFNEVMHTFTMGGQELQFGKHDGYYSVGGLDEIRIAGRALAPEWSRAEHRNRPADPGRGWRNCRAVRRGAG